jgi:uncharacterized membrane protein
MTASLFLDVLATRITLADGPAALRAMLLVHVLAGAVALATGYVALYAAKGSALHRKSGIWFVYAIVTMGVFGVVINVFEGEDWGAGLLIAYFVVSALETVRPAAERRRWLEVGGMLVAAFLGVASLFQGLAMVLGGELVREGVPAPMFLFFGTVVVLAAASDVRVIRRGGLHGRPRLVRHLWRMCFALFIAAGSFFVGQAHTFPEALRHPALIAVPVLVPLLAMPYWVWRLRRRNPAPVLLSAGESALLNVRSCGLHGRPRPVR